MFKKIPLKYIEDILQVRLYVSERIRIEERRKIITTGFR
jgi:hypothetical protein